MTIWQELTDMIKEGDVNAEMVKKFKDTIIKMRRKPSDPWVYVRYYGWNGDSHIVYDISTGNEHALTRDSALEIRIPYLTYGCYTNHKAKMLMFGMSLPYRQWKKGMCNKNTLLQFPFDGSNVFSTNIETILTTTQVPITLEEAVKRITTNGYYSTAITRDWGLTLDFNADTDNLILFYKTIPVGQINVKEKTITLTKKCFHQELSDTSRDWCLNWSVV